MEAGNLVVYLSFPMGWRVRLRRMRLVASPSGPERSWVKRCWMGRSSGVETGCLRILCQWLPAVDGGGEQGRLK